MTKVVCDLCGKEIQNERQRRKFKIKERKTWMDNKIGWVTEWVYIDTHDECVRTILQTVKTNRETDACQAIKRKQEERC